MWIIEALMSALNGGGSTELIIELLVGLATRVFIIFCILPIHECAHAWAAYKLGDPTAKNMGRLTLNPLAHIDWVGAACIMFIGFGWAKPVPVNPVYFNNQKARQRGMAFTAMAGPASNLLVAIIGTVLYRLAFSFEAIYNSQVGVYLDTVFQLIIFINFGLAFFNLLPIPPLDGSKILNWILPDKWVYNLERFMQKYSTFVSIAFIALIFTGVLDTPIYWLENTLFKLVWSGADWLFNLVGLECPFYWQ